MDNILEAGDMISCFTSIKGEEYMIREKLFKKLLTKNRINILENAINILLLTHNDLDGSAQ